MTKYFLSHYMYFAFSGHVYVGSQKPPGNLVNFFLVSVKSHSLTINCIMSLDEVDVKEKSLNLLYFLYYIKIDLDLIDLSWQFS